MSIGEDKIFIARPVFPMVTNPVLDPNQSDGVRGHTTGFGDIEVFTLFGPSRMDGVVWGIGSTFRFPTATSDRLGQGKYQAGPAAMRPWDHEDHPHRQDAGEAPIRAAVLHRSPGRLRHGVEHPPPDHTGDSEPVQLTIEPT